MSRESKFTLVDWVRVFLSVKSVDEDKRFESFKTAALERAKELGIESEYSNLSPEAWKTKINSNRAAVANKIRLVNGKPVGLFRKSAKSGDNTVYIDKDCTVPLPKDSTPYNLPSIPTGQRKTRSNMDDLLSVLSSDFPTE